MLHALQVVTVISVSVAMALALAHALELPGKLRLTKEAYYAMQSIYYPGFTIGGIGEAGGLLLSIILLLLTPMGSADFSLTLVGLLGPIGMQAVYWIFTHPVNRFWLRGGKLGSFGSGFCFSQSEQRDPRLRTRLVRRIGWNCVTAGSTRMLRGPCWRCSA